MLSLFFFIPASNHYFIHLRLIINTSSEGKSFPSVLNALAIYSVVGLVIAGRNVEVYREYLRAINSDAFQLFLV